MIPKQLVFAAPGKDERREVRSNDRVSRPVRLRAAHKRRQLVCGRKFLSVATKAEGGCEEEPRRVGGRLLVQQQSENLETVLAAEKVPDTDWREKMVPKSSGGSERGGD